MTALQGMLALTQGWRSLDPVRIQRQQLFNLFVLFLAGKFFLDFPITWPEICAILMVAVALDHALILLRTGQLGYFSYSAVNSALGVIFLLRATDIWIYVAMVAIGLAQKHVLTINGRHFLNPSNIAVVFGLTLFPYNTFTTPEQWGTFWWLGGAMMILGLLVLWRVDRYLVMVSFAVAYAGATYVLITHNLMQIGYVLLSGSFLLFMLFMITDPRTTPSDWRRQVAFGAGVAVLSIVLELLLGARQSTMFVALFGVSLLRAAFLVRNMKNFLPVGTAVAATVLALAWSPFLSSSQAWFAPAFSLNAQPEAGGPPVEKARKIVWGSDGELYQTSWTAPFVLSRPLNPQPRAKVLRPGPADLSTYKPAPEPRHAGLDYAYHAPVTAGDINHDGYIDLVFAQLNRPLSVLLSDGKGGFTDATNLLFDGPVPFAIDLLALADLDNDSYLDLIVIPNPYEAGAAPNAIHMFNPVTRKFHQKQVLPMARRATSGGLALADVNGDGILDIYLSFSHDWHQEKPPLLFFLSDGVSNQFWVSGLGGWSERKADYFPDPIEEHAGMTVQFSDIDNDGRADFLLGNDSQPDLTYLGQADGRFALIDKARIEYNAHTSMGYVAADFDNDGAMELWEDAISDPPDLVLTRYGEQVGSLYANLFSQLRALNTSAQKTTDLCDFYQQNSPEYDYCATWRRWRMGMRTGEKALCEDLPNLMLRNHCLFFHSGTFDPASPLKKKADIARYPRKVKKNILLDQDADGVFRDILGHGDAALTGWTWAAYPFDIDNDGLLDLYVTNGMATYPRKRSMYARPFERSALLMNHGETGKVRLENMAEAYGLDLPGIGRGVIVADFDNDGDGDIFENRLLKAPAYIQNGTGGDAVLVELRSNSGNYFGLGARITLNLEDGQKTREMASGGIWDSSAPTRVHFGLGDGETPVSLDVTWPSGGQSRYPLTGKNQIYFVYE